MEALPQIQQLPDDLSKHDVDNSHGRAEYFYNNEASTSFSGYDNSIYIYIYGSSFYHLTTNQAIIDSIEAPRTWAAVSFGRKEKIVLFCSIFKPIHG